eukprot:TRINITY_DN16998_c0_g1_i1.p1 TRINITY_DN16998_c0_g1~~TRINITY_DN16998_c0_g1_i1.p1  ORF type:complete len:320 (-),score=65.01 TRINITY_DN16998_c0_g1_i1:300-1259(-)
MAGYPTLLLSTQQYKPVETVPTVPKASSPNRGGGAAEFEAEFEELEQLGRGEFGIVRRAKHRKTGHFYAVKHVRLSASNEKQRNQEVKLLSMLNHHHIVSLIRYFETPTELLLVQELCDGGSLPDHLSKRSEGRQLGSSVECASIVYQLLSALDHCHDLGFVHGDLKMDNIMFAQQNVLKLIDFGNSRHCPTVDVAEDQSADMWSVGLILYQLITGQPFFITDSFQLESLDDQGVYVDPARMKCDSVYVDLRISLAKRVAEGLVLDLLGKMLVLDKATRITAKEALDHPFTLLSPTVKRSTSDRDRFTSVSTACSEAEI